MSDLIPTVNLTFYGCPLHYIKARESLSDMVKGQEIILKVNNDDAVDEVLSSLRHDGQICEILSEDTLTTMIKVKKYNDRN